MAINTIFSDEKAKQKKLYQNFLRYAREASGRNYCNDDIGVRTTAWSLTSWTINALNGKPIKIYNKQAFEKVKKYVHDIVNYEYKTKPLNTIEPGTGQPAYLSVRDSIASDEIVDNSAMSLGGIYLIGIGIAALLAGMSLAAGVPIIIAGIGLLALGGVQLYRMFTPKKSNFEKLQTRLLDKLNPQAKEAVYTGQDVKNEKLDSLSQISLFSKLKRPIPQKCPDNEIPMMPLTA